jgi:MFS family permease
VPNRLPSRDPVERALTSAIVASSLAIGVFYAVSALYFTRVVDLPATTVGLGLTVAGAVGVVASYVGGPVSDRWGADRVMLGATAWHGAGLLAYVFADGTLWFVLIACWAVGTRSLQGTARSALLARWFTGAERVTVRARLRVVTNVCIGLGTCLAAVALAVDTAAAYRVAMAAVGVSALVACLPLIGLRARVPDLALRMRPLPAADGGAPAGRSPLRDRTYLAAVAGTSVIAMQFGLLTVGVPLWIADHTTAPEVLISVLMVLNTALVALFQVRAARGTHDIVRAGRAVRRGGLLLALACLLYAAAGGADVVVAVTVLVLAELVGSAAEVFSEAGSWGLAFELADPVNAGAYQGVSQTGYAVAGMLAPALVTATAIDHGTWGWVLLAVLFAGAGCGTAAVAGRAAARAPMGEPEPVG